MSKKNKRELRKIRHKRVRKKVKGIKEKPRLCVFRSNKHIYVQIIDDEKAHTLVSVSSLEKDFRVLNKKFSTSEGAYHLGKLLAERAKKAGIVKVCFDRGGYPYQGRVKKLAEGAREGGLIF